MDPFTLCGMAVVMGIVIFVGYILVQLVSELARCCLRAVGARGPRGNERPARSSSCQPEPKPSVGSGPEPKSSSKAKPRSKSEIEQHLFCKFVVRPSVPTN